MNKKNIKTEAVVLLLAALMAFSSVTVLANTNISTKPASPAGRDLVWDNVVGVHGALGGIIVATVRTEGNAMPADDFKLDAAKEVSSIFWQGGYFQCQLATGAHDYNWDWRVYFWNDDGTGNHPTAWGTYIYNETISDANISRAFWYNYTRPDNGNVYWVANYSAQLPAPITFNANTKYWVTIQGLQDGNAYPQACWSRHNASVGGIKLHEAEIFAAYWGYSTWTNLSVLVPDFLPHDLNFQLFGGAPQDTTPPVTHCSYNGTNPVTVTITATDDMSGVNHTYYNLDAAGYVEYTAPFQVTVPGNHTMWCYSVDKAGNQEVPHYCNFTVTQPAIGITIKKGLGITAVIKNTGTATLTNIPWTIKLTGGVIIIGKTAFGSIASLAPAASEKVKDFVLGFGKTSIAVTAGSASATGTGIVLIIIVL